MEKNLNLKAEVINGLGILQLAYMGDAVIELFARRELLLYGNFQPGRLTKMAKGYVTCEAQSDAVERIIPMLTPDEESVFKRGRNSKTHHVPSHGELIQYKRATGFEALMGYLFLSGSEDRASELFSAAYDGTAKSMIEKIK